MQRPPEATPLPPDEVAVVVFGPALTAREPALAAREGAFVAPIPRLKPPPRERADDEIMKAWRRFGPLVERTLRRLLGSDEEVRDLSQEAFLQLYRSVPSLRSPKAIRPFVDGIAVRLALHELRRRRIRAGQVLLPGQGLVPPRSTTADPEAREAMARLLGMVGRLRAEDQEIFMLSEVAGCEQTEICAATGMSVSTVRRRLRRIRGRMDTLLNADPALADYVERGRRREE